MLTELVIENFKAFGERQSLRLAPVTLVFGGNSAGKSSIIQSLLLMRQSQGLQNRPFGARPAELVVRGELTDLGSFDALVHRHDRERVLEVGWSAPMERSARDRRRSLSGGPDVGVSVRFQRLPRASGIEYLGSTLDAGSGVCRLDRLKGSTDVYRELADLGGLRQPGGDPELLIASEADTIALLEAATALEYPQGPSEQRSLRSSDPGGSPIPNQHVLDSIRQSGYRAVLSASSGLPARVMALLSAGGDLITSDWQGEQPALFDDLEALHAALNMLNGLILDCSQSSRRAVSRIAYLGPMRQAPERLHVLSGESVRGSGARGEHVVDLLARRPRLLAEVNDWFARLEIPYALDIRAVTDKAMAGAIGEVHCLLLRDQRTGVEVATTDVGFGIGQVLPVVVESVLSPRGTLCIEQPEIHLHPGLQARLAELFAERASRYGQQFVLETHSEHLILRLQRLVRRGELDSRQISVLHVGPGEGGDSRVTPLRLGENGEFIDEWPDGFFDERFDEIFED